jgi:hypothetical protein
MNEQFDCTRGAHASAEKMNGHAVDTELAESGPKVGHDDTFRHSNHDIADRLRVRPLSLRDHELRPENGHTNEFMTVFSHELRNSLLRIP